MTLLTYSLVSFIHLNAVAQHANVWKKRHLAIKAAQAEFQPIRVEEVFWLGLH